jgi:hypothetical protein
LKAVGSTESTITPAAKLENSNIIVVGHAQFGRGGLTLAGLAARAHFSMTAIDFILIAVGVFVLAFIWVRLADAWDARRVARCIRSIGVAKCPRCKRVLGEDAVSAAEQRMIKFTKKGVWRQRGHDHPSRLVAVVCLHCAAELEFRLDGSLFSCDRVVAT